MRFNIVFDWICIDTKTHHTVLLTRLLLKDADKSILNESESLSMPTINELLHGRIYRSSSLDAIDFVHETPYVKAAIIHTLCDRLAYATDDYAMHADLYEPDELRIMPFANDHHGNRYYHFAANDDCNVYRERAGGGLFEHVADSVAAVREWKRSLSAKHDRRLIDAVDRLLPDLIDAENRERPPQRSASNGVVVGARRARELRQFEQQILSKIARR